MLRRILAAIRRALPMFREVTVIRGTPPEARKIVKRLRFYWHFHHDVVAEPLLHPLEQRRRYIRKYKPALERELRLRLIKPVKGKLPKEVIRAGRAVLKAFARTETIVAENLSGHLDGHSTHHAYANAWHEYVRCHDVYKNCLRQHSAEIDALHRAECPACPWNGRTIFPQEAV